MLFVYPTLVVLLPMPVSPLAVAPDVRLGAGNTLLGGALVLGSALSFAIYIMRSGQAVLRLGSTRFTAYATAIACVLCVLQFIVLRPWAALLLP